MTRWFKPHNAELSLRPPWKVALLLLALALPGAWLGDSSVRLMIAENLAKAATLPDLRRAEALAPFDPKIQKILGTYLCYTEEPHLAEGLMHLRLATKLCPLGAQYWYALASACELATDSSCADDAFERAVQLSPSFPRYLWAAANHNLVEGRQEKALGQFSRLLQMNQGYDMATFRICTRATGDPQLVFQKVLAPAGSTTLDVAYVNFLSFEGRNDDAQSIWKEAIQKPATFPLSSVDPYIERLLALGQGHAALNVWKDLEKLGLVPSSGSPDNLVYNGSFEQPSLNMGLDWHFPPAPYLTVDAGDSDAKEGSRCLRLGFTVQKNEEFLAAYQYVPVTPNQQYELSAYVRSDSITSDSGPRLRVQDAACATCLDVMSESTVGTTSWHQSTLKFATGQETHLLKLSVVRMRSRSFPMEITGDFWLDAISLKQIGPVNVSTNLRAAH